MFGLLVRTVGWIGAQGTRAVALSLVVGMAVPPLSAVMKPLIPHAVFLLLVVAFARVDLGAVRARLKNAARVLLVVGWIMVLLPAVVWLVLTATGIDGREPGVVVAIVVMVIAPPIMSSPAFSYLLGLDGALSLTVLVATMIATPILCPLIAGLMLGDLLPISAPDLAVRLSLLLAGSVLCAAALRFIMGRQHIERSGTVFDGLNVILLFIFAVAIMDGVAARVVSDPGLVLFCLVTSFAIAIGFMLVSFAAFRRFGAAAALTVAVSSGNRNMGLLAAAMSGAIPDTGWIYIAVAQVPIYTLPMLMKPVVTRMLRPAGPPE